MNTQQLYFTLKLFSALGCGLMAGVFFAFSSFVMNALAQLQASQGITAMQLINIKVINPSFMLVFLGTAVACIFLAISSLLKWHQPSSDLKMITRLKGHRKQLAGVFSDNSQICQYFRPI